MKDGVIIIKEKIINILKEILWLDTKNFNNLTLSNLEQKMKVERFVEEFMNDFMDILEQKFIEFDEVFFENGFTI
ncbi:hypothetical protein [Paraliobacillus sp. JSM ZJ581]|uniref:hypothetical protein n=1 Tax=Paraliobacillus sp. JSM ZJ581 TaxID=3342118 RepID=UPI0035A84F41